MYSGNGAKTQTRADVKVLNMSEMRRMETLNWR
jgi:hypothetical protein